MALSKFVDMHVHTTASDGTCTPSEMVRLAYNKGLSAVAITDHDTTAGVEEATAEGKRLGIEILPGIEISTSVNGQEIHVLGYYTNNNDEIWQGRLAQLRDTRGGRNEKLIQRLNELGIDITMHEVVQAAGEGAVSIGRPHFAHVLVNKGYVDSVKEAFDLYLGDKGKAYCSPLRIHPVEAFQWIREAGGVCVLAHPGIYHAPELVEQLLEQKPDGVEVYHSDHTKDDIEWLSSLAEKYSLLITGGSDFHGQKGQGELYHGDLGSVTLPIEYMEKLRGLQEKRN